MIRQSFRSQCKIVGTFTCTLLAMTRLTCEADVKDAGDPPAPACPAPVISKINWRKIIIKEWLVQFDLPPEYSRNREQEASDGSIRSFHTDRLDNVTVTLGTGALIIPKRDFAFGRADTGYSECREMINGHEAIMQSYRGGGWVVRNAKSTLTYRAAAVYQISPGRFLEVVANTLDRRSQEEMLAAFRTIQVTQ
jgi:hypothetical protein